MSIAATATPIQSVVPEKMILLWALNTRHGACITHTGSLSSAATYQLGVLSLLGSMLIDLSPSDANQLNHHICKRFFVKH